MAEAETRCLLDQETQSALLEIVRALRAETPTIETSEGEIDLEALEERISSCSNTEKRGQRKRGPRAPSRYNNFISECRRSTEKGGRGLSFEDCVAEWKSQNKK